MKKFEFSLQRVLDYRQMVAEWARDAYLEARKRLEDAQAGLVEIDDRRRRASESAAATVSELLDHERYRVRLDDERRAQETIIAILDQEVEAAYRAWVEKRIEAEALEKLREQALAEYEEEARRAEQRELDEWAVLRRRAA
ncbi:MAG TPA: flagellar export protein FliJ [Fimbriimonadaceae bacterium]|nr:flagellar export protein FliJ [Fimbriimonadaceae bacterium]HRJ95377.1 flagellar export protein FliJ [Fimbriimonadaceae bacterium]